MALLIPLLVVVKRLSNIPIKPLLLNPVKAAWYKALPKEIIGILLPTKEKSLIRLYIPKNERIAPVTTKILVIWPGVSFVLSKIIWPIIEINPTRIKAFK